MVAKKPEKKISQKERDFADLMIQSQLGSIEAARKVFGWRCEPGSSEARKAVNLKNTRRVREYMAQKEEQLTRETEAHKIFLDTSVLEWDRIRKFAFDRLEAIRDNPQQKAQVRFNAIQALKKLSDPSKDTALILMWLSLLWRGAKAHCPRCHNTFPLYKVKNKFLEEWWSDNGEEPPKEVETTFDRRMEILTRSDRRKKPHRSQVIALSAEERHIAGKGAARGGKSLLLAWMALLFFLIPGVEIWILSRVYEDARSEVDYLKRFLNTLFYPFYDKMFKETFDTRTSELILLSKWGSELRVRSAKSKGSITGRELEAALVAEPGWVPEELYEELRARMSSRLGRIIMFGTPKGFGGILGRMLAARGRDENGRVVRIPPEKRTLAAGCPWGWSLLSYNLDPSDNPEYVKSELQSARWELMDEEYASEFQGIMTLQEGAKFPQIRERHLVNIPFEGYNNSVFVLGVDQGPKNFAACLVGYDGKRIIGAREYFEQDAMTMKYHMDVLRNSVPNWIKQLGGMDNAWRLTIFDVDPNILPELNEFELENRPWPTEITFRPKRQKGTEQWRPEVYEYINSLAAPANPQLIFDMQHCQLLHDQLMMVQNKPENPDRDGMQPNSKMWVVNDPWRGDHVLDAFVMALWTIFSNQLRTDVQIERPHQDPWREHQAVFDYQRRIQEKKELSGFSTKEERKSFNVDKIFKEEFGRERPARTPFRGISPYKDY